MGNDMVVALKEASANGSTLFAVNHYHLPTQRHRLQRIHGKHFDLGEKVQTSTLELPQARQTFSVLGVQPVGRWGYAHGVNEHRVTMGVTQWQSRLAGESDALTGLDLVRLTLERSHSARHAVEVLPDLIERHGQSNLKAGALPALHDHLFLIADRAEAYVLEACGRHWALMQCRDTRVVTNAAMIHQDWCKIAPGLAAYAIEHGWWRDDGSKLDFVRCLGVNTEQARAAQRRWGHASLALSQQDGAIDLHYLRRMLADHYESHAEAFSTADDVTLANSFLVDLYQNEEPVLAWVAFGTPSASVYFPLCLEGELPSAFSGGHPESPTIQDRVRDIERLAATGTKDQEKVTLALERLQTRFDDDAEKLLAKSHDGMKQQNPLLLTQLATEMMHHHVEAFEKEYRRLFDLEEKSAAPEQVPEELLFFA